MRVDGTIAAVFGVPGSGKTTLAIAFVERALTSRPVVIYDPTRDLRTYLDEHEIPWTPAHPDRLPADVLASKRTGQPRAFIVEEPMDLWRVAASDALRGCSVVIDEAQQAFPSAGMTKPATKYLELNRNRSIETVVIAKRPQKVSTDVRCNAQHVIVFRQQSQAALDCLADCADVRVWARTLELPQFVYLYRPPWQDDALADLDEYSTEDPLPYDWPPGD